MTSCDVLATWHNKLGVWSPKAKIGLVSATIGGYFWWKQYGKLLLLQAQGYPKKVDLGLPILGHISFLWEGLAPWGKRLYDTYGKVFVVFLMGQHVTVIDWSVYEKYAAKLEDAGELNTGWPPHLMQLLGSNSVITLRAGNNPACARHKLIKAKLMQALAPRQVLLLAPRMEAAARRMLDACVQETAARGEVSLKRFIHRYAFENAAVSVLGDLADDQELLDTLQDLADKFQEAALSLLPVDLPCFAFGRSMNARRQMARIISSLMGKAENHDSQRNVLAQLTKPSAAGRALTEEEVVDSMMTVLIAGIVTTSYTIPHVIVNLWKHASWKERIASENKNAQWTLDSSIEGSTHTLQFVRETMRQVPALDVFRRTTIDGPLDLGEYGKVPAGAPFAILFASNGYDMGTDFDPTRWTPELSKAFVGFGGHGPHQCAGKNLALLEIQVVAQIISSSYKVEVLDDTITAEVIGMHFKDGLRVKVTRADAMHHK